MKHFDIRLCFDANTRCLVLSSTVAASCCCRTTCPSCFSRPSSSTRRLVSVFVLYLSLYVRGVSKLKSRVNAGEVLREAGGVPISGNDQDVATDRDKGAQHMEYWTKRFCNRFQSHKMKRRHAFSKSFKLTGTRELAHHTEYEQKHLESYF